MGATSAETCMYGTCEQSEKETHRSLSDWFRFPGGRDYLAIFNFTFVIDRHNRGSTPWKTQE